MRRAPTQQSCHPSLSTRVVVTLLTLGLAALVVQADDTGAVQSRALFRELEEVSISADQPYLLTASQTVDGANYRLSYNNQFPGEQMGVLPGGQLNIHLINRLDGLPVDVLTGLNPKVIGRNDDEATKNMISEASSVTNLHTHGLHVSPAERSDNVMLKINSGKVNTYAIDLPLVHAPGTHWYHSHLHGSTALQVQGGMAGALIVDPLEGQSLNPPGFRVQERIMVLQFGAGWKFNEAAVPSDGQGLASMSRKSLTRIQTSRLAELIDVETEDDLHAFASRLDSSELSELMGDIDGLRLDLPPVFVNGLENPVLHVQQDVAVQRFRVVNAGSRFPDYKKLWIENPANRGESLPMYVAAIDGVNLIELPKNAQGEYIAYTETNPLELAPGNRADIFFLPDTAGTFTLMMEGEIGLRDSKDGATSPASLTEEQIEPKRLKFQRALLTLEVGGPDVEQAMAKAAGRAVGPTAFLETLDQHLKNLQDTIPAYRDGYLRPFSDIGDYIKRKIEFDVQRGPGRLFLINGRSYNEKNNHGHMSGHDDYLGKMADDGGRGPNGETPWPLRSDTEEEWTITNISNRVHPFHIHVSPFWIVDIVEEVDGNLVSVKATNRHDPRLNRWQDVVTLPPKGGSVTVRHRVSQFTGIYVIHCHILQHEDRGMMINVLTVPKEERNPQGFFDGASRRNAAINKEIGG